MPQFAYRAKKPTGEVVTGTLVAESRRGALDVVAGRDFRGRATRG